MKQNGEVLNDGACCRCFAFLELIEITDLRALFTVLTHSSEAPVFYLGVFLLLSTMELNVAHNLSHLLSNLGKDYVLAM